MSPTPLARGRSRDVALSALARKADQRRRAELLSPSPSPHSSRSTSSESLTESLHIAYAQDDIHQAKVFLLRLKGISITDDNDPRMCAIQPNDFFCPAGGLVSGKDDWKKNVYELPNEERKRMQRLWKEDEDRRRGQRKCREPAEERRRDKISYASLAPASNITPQQAPLEYPCMTMQSHLLKTRPTAAQRSTLTTATTGSRTRQKNGVTLQEISLSMQGSLFPDDGPITSRKGPSSKEAKLLHLLLETVKWELGEKARLKGKERAVPALRRNSTRCQACSPTSSSIFSRPSSWLSFGSTSSSVSTALTSASPSSPSWQSKWQKPPESPPSACPRHLERRQQIPFSQGPLPPSATLTKRERKQDGPVSRLGKSVSRFIEMAFVFQNAYTITPSAPINNNPLKPPGYRATKLDVASFISQVDSPFDSANCIPLLSPFPPPIAPRTTLPNPLPYPIVFKPQILPPPSPPKLGFQTSHRESRSVSMSRRSLPRPRIISNPMFLRLHALRNVIWERGLVWEGHSREGMLGDGKDKMPGIAFEESGRSLLAVG